MAKLTVGQKGERTFRFLLGATNPQVLAMLAGYGFSKDDLDEGWALLRAVADEKLDRPPPVPKPDPSLLEVLDGWENKWLLVGDVALERHYPACRERVFLNISRQAGADVVFSTSTFIQRVEALATGTAEEQAARALLAKRGLTDAVLAEAKAILDEIAGGKIAEIPPTPDPAKEEPKGEAADAMWAWYLEWSTLARHEIKDRRVLMSLGFRGSYRKRAGDEEADDATEDDVEDLDDASPDDDADDDGPLDA